MISRLEEPQRPLGSDTSSHLKRSHDPQVPGGHSPKRPRLTPSPQQPIPDILTSLVTTLRSLRPPASWPVSRLTWAPGLALCRGNFPVARASIWIPGTSPLPKDGSPRRHTSTANDSGPHRNAIAGFASCLSPDRLRLGCCLFLDFEYTPYDLEPEHSSLHARNSAFYVLEECGEADSVDDEPTVDEIISLYENGFGDDDYQVNLNFFATVATGISGLSSRKKGILNA